MARYVEVDVSCSGTTSDEARTTRCVPCLVDLVHCPAQVTTVTYGHDGRPLVCPLRIYGSSPDSTADGAHMENSAVEALVAGTRPPPSHWYGPALVLKCENLAMNSFVDVTSSDLVDIHAFFALR